MIPKRKVVSAEKIDARHYKLTLECGHVTMRRISGNRLRPQKSVWCDDCGMALDRLAAADDWASARDLKVPKAVLEFLYREGLLDSSSPPHSPTVYFRLVRKAE